VSLASNANKKAADPQPLRICGSVVPSPQEVFFGSETSGGGEDADPATPSPLVLKRLSTIDGYCLDLPLTEIDFDLESAKKKGTLLFDLLKTGFQQPEDAVQIPGWWNLVRRLGGGSG